ncbi:MAG: DUF3783 domain-containing protein [Ruminococcus sp.]|nr:DUF3783 domain-containing protein [Ruminococcus sp.]
MKAHIANSFTEKMLIYASAEKAAKLKEICRRQAIVPVTLGDVSLTEKIGNLAALTGNTAEHPSSAEDSRECVVFCNFREKTLDGVLREIRRNIPGGIPLKAVLTPSNGKMTLDELLSELQMEHDRLEKGG